MAIDLFADSDHPDTETAFQQLMYLLNKRLDASNIANGAITTAVRQSMNTQSLTLTCPTGAATTFSFAVSSGPNSVTPRLGTPLLGNGDVTCTVIANTSTQIQVSVFNASGVSGAVTCAIEYW